MGSEMCIRDSFTAGANAGDPATVSAADIETAFATVKTDASAGDTSFIVDYVIEQADGTPVTSTYPFDEFSLDLSAQDDGSAFVVVTRVTDAAGNVAHTDDVKVGDLAADITLDKVDPALAPADGSGVGVADTNGADSDLILSDTQATGGLTLSFATSEELASCLLYTSPSPRDS